MGKILLIDDDPVFTRLLGEYIAEQYPLLAVDVCNNPLEALTAIRRAPYDLILIDFEMPTLDGRKLMNFAVQSGIEKNRIVILSSRDADFLHEQCPMGSCLAVLNKHEVRQKAVLDMIFSSLSKKAVQED
ncbi:Response regulator receiver domain-containing protein [Trichlorobacter thiogenes]|uniref:Response regulator receiver domain-containing protein n=1 Tax=Trichlorobacter thiogenes TaxID=115783 RepID=A0A1T4MKE2_9BACT|nr:response regulator [Trichlorobacter thiogenes]SJZ67228.1 Response regulator receiver domain-containing protein [Trichlorobacter thiogenes]